MHRAADDALDTGQAVALDDLVLVPDIVLIEAAAQGDAVDASKTWRLVRDDGRSVSVYRHRSEA